MIKEAFGLADTIDEAKESAFAQLNVSEDAEVSYEVIDIPKKKVLGIFGGNQAKVRAYIETPDPEPKKPTHAPKAEKAPRAKEQHKPEKAVQPNPAKPEKPEKPVREEPVYSEPVDADTLDENCPAAKAVAYLKVILTHFGCSEINCRVALREGAAKLYLTGESMGVLIGHRGETLDALQYLSSLAAGNAGGYYKITLDIGNYREKRESTLTGLAGRIATQVLRTGRSRALEPMNPYERRIIHTAVQDIEGVVSNSTGEGINRHVVISPVGGEKRAPHRPSGTRQGGQRAPRNNAPTQTAPAHEPKKDSGSLPLYGKIK